MKRWIVPRPVVTAALAAMPAARAANSSDTIPLIAEEEDIGTAAIGG